MAAPVRPSCTTQCLASLRNFPRLRLHDSWLVCQQIRGAKKSAAQRREARFARKNINVRLLQDVKGFGPKGSLVPVGKVIMRTIWFPQRIADYIPYMEVKQMKISGIVFERDPLFVSAKSVGAVEAKTSEKDQSLHARRRESRVSLDLLTPERSAELVEIFVPKFMDFKRARIAENSASKDTEEAPTSSDDTSIYGSVSTQDVLNVIKSNLIGNDEASRVVLSENDVEFKSTDKDVDTSRVKQLGNFEVEIRPKGATNPIIRTVRILPSDQSRPSRTSLDQ